ncbi:hypothetical protein [Rhizobium sp. BK008]|uniref:hypothetical protein n=1 Tax=Rhizobium sp. BK008 TaxID=2587094 RepID=UPI00160B998F|nr:hypothetical protein [Rhizobium sp. BK008]MBB4253013.1 hypothetical protein [Rhizobium sp. BK008]
MTTVDDGRRCPLSPGPVQSSEFIALGLYSPDLIDKTTGKITKEALKTDVLKAQAHVDLCGDSSGLSVARLIGISSVDELKSTIGQIAARPKNSGVPREVFGHATVLVDWLMKNGAAVLDDGKVGFTSHAVVRTSMGKAEVKKLREDLINQLNRNVVRW